MVVILPYVFALIIVIITVVEEIRFRNYRKPEKVAKKFALIAIVFGILHLICDFYPFDYTGGTGIDYIGQAVAYSLFINAIIYSTLIVYLNFAVAASVYAVKAIKNKKTRKKGILWLVLSWICALVVAGIVIGNIISDDVRKNSIKVGVKEVTSVTDTDGKPSALVVLEFYNGTGSDITYLSTVYDEVSQNGQEIYDTNIEDSGIDYEIEAVKPGCSVEIRKAYRLDDPSEPVKIVCQSYDGYVVYVDAEYEVK